MVDTSDADSHREVGVAANEVVDQVRELGLGDDLLGVQVEALEEVLVRLPAAQLVLHLLEEVQLLRQVGPRKALLLCSALSGDHQPPVRRGATMDAAHPPSVM